MTISRNMAVDADRFAFALDKIIEDVASGVDSSLTPAVRAGCKKARDSVRYNAVTMWPDSDYPTSFSYHTEKNARGLCEGEVGSASKPGLVHLLEKGHLTVGGMLGGPGRTRAFPHMEPAYEESKDVFYATLLKGVGRAL